MPVAAAAWITSSSRLAPSSRLYWEWRWRWTKSDIAALSGLSRRRRLHGHPVGAHDVLDPGTHGERRHQVDQELRRRLVLGIDRRAEHDEDRGHLRHRVDLRKRRGREARDAGGQ